MSKLAPDKMEASDWKLLEHMRQAYTGDFAAKVETRWSDARSLALYDKFFGRRIADKWDSALEDFASRGHGEFFRLWVAARTKPLQVWDWGCGTGRASRTFLKSLEAVVPLEIVLTDRSPAVEDWAWSALKEEFPIFKSERKASGDLKIGDFVLLVSHVLNELSSAEAGRLADVAGRSAWIFWVENGSKATSRSLAAVRNKLRHTHEILAPCLGQTPCEAIEGKPHTHWCHFFAGRSSEYFLDPEWTEFSKQLGIDLRSLPYSFFMARKKSLSSEVESGGPIRWGRHLGRARVHKGYADALVCNQETRLVDWRYNKKQFAELYKALKKERAPRVLPEPRTKI